MGSSKLMEARIARIETRVVRYPISGQFKFFQGIADRACVLVKVASENGEWGWGQAVPSPTWSYETLETVQTTIDRYLAPALIGQDAFDTLGIQSILRRTIAPSFSTGQPICKAGLELALFDLTGRLRQQTATQRWRRSDSDRITMSWTINPPTLDDLAPNVELARSRGYRHFNVKVGAEPAADVALCRELRRLAPEAFLWVDANGGYDLESALAVAPQFASLGIAAFEQPVSPNRLSALRKLRQQGALPILLDEGVVSRVDLEEFHQLGILDGVAMKVARCGGLEEARQMIEYLESEGLLLFASGLTDPDVSLAASVLLFSAYGLSRPAALNGPQYLTGSYLVTPLTIHGDQIIAPDGPGLGIEVDESRLREGGCAN